MFLRLGQLAVGHAAFAPWLRARLPDSTVFEVTLRSLSLQPDDSRPSFRWLVDRLQSLGLPPLCYPSYGGLTISPVGLFPTKHVHLFWTHNQAAAFDRISRSSLSLRFSRRS